MAENEKTEHYKIPKPNIANFISDDTPVLQMAFDIIDLLFREFATEIAKKMDGDAELTISDIEGLTEELAKKMADDRRFKLVEMEDVLGFENALDNYILTKAGAGFVLRSALAVIGAHAHAISDVNGLQPVLNTLVSGPSGVLEGEIPLFQGTTGKALRGSGMKFVDLILSLDAKATSAQLAALADTVATALAQKLGKTEPAADSTKFGGETVAQWNAKAWPGVYTGSNPQETVFPVGHTVLINAYSYTNTGTQRNDTAIVRISVTGSIDIRTYDITGTGAALSGVYRLRGATGGSGNYAGMYQRTE